MMFKSLPFGFMLLTILMVPAHAREWRGIVPLKSTKADVERLLGEPNQLGRYEIENELVSIFYSKAICVDRYNLAKPICECFVPKDTVLRIAVTLNRAVKVSQFGIDKNNYERTLFNANPPTATYANFKDGVVYTIRESDDAVTNIDYLPSAKDCEATVRAQQQAAAPANVWQGIVPFSSTRSDVERLLGASKSSIGETYIYETAENRVDVSYSSDPCQINAVASGIAADVVLKTKITPRRTVLIKELRLDKGKYLRIQNSHPENWVEYKNSADGITVEALLDNGCEQVISIVYQATKRDRGLRCGGQD